MRHLLFIRRLIIGVAVVLAASSMAGQAPVAEETPVAAKQAGAVFELRTYTTHEGRLPALEARFRDHTMALFEKHGMRNVGYWIPVDKPNTLIYIIAHANADAIRQNWKAFGGDPAWQAVARESQKDGRILIEGGIQSQFMSAAAFSPIQ